MTKKKWLLMLSMSILFVFSCVMLAACAEPGVALKWEIDEHATVSVVGEEELPQEWPQDEELVFTVTCADGYEVDTVRAGNKALKANDNNQYSVVISAETTITVTVSKIVSSVSITKAPTKLTYYAGESLDTTGMEVTVTYEDDSTEKVTDYVVSPSTFSIGDTSFTVSYSGHASAAVNLTAPVEALVVIDAAGGTIDADWISALQARTDIKNFNLAASSAGTGVISFTYTELTSEITLPTAEQVKRGEKEGDFNYVGWYANATEDSDGTETKTITKENTISLDLVLKWDARLVTLNSIRLTQEDAAGKDGAFLVMNVTFETAESVYIYLYEGNAKVELVGTEYTGSTGETKDVYFDLSILGNHENGSYNGKWMDLCFNAEIDERTYTQSFALDHENPIADVGAAVQDKNYSYTLLTHRPDNSTQDYIKVAFTEYNTTYAFDVDGNILTVSGKINSNKLPQGASLTGATVSLEMGDKTGTGSIDAEGNWSIDYDLTQMAACGATQFGNLVVTGADETELLNATLRYTQATDTFAYNDGLFSNPSYYSNRYEFGNNMVLHVGNMGSDWQNAFFSIVDEGHALNYTSVTLVAGDNGQPMLVFTGTYGPSYAVDEVETAITEAFYLDLQSYPSWPYRWYSSTGVADNPETEDVDESQPANFVVKAEADGTFTVTCDLSIPGQSDKGDVPSAFTAGDVIYGHFGPSSSNMSMNYVEGTVTYEGLTYTLTSISGQNENDNWINGLTGIMVTEAAA